MTKVESSDSSGGESAPARPGRRTHPPAPAGLPVEASSGCALRDRGRGRLVVERRAAPRLGAQPRAVSRGGSPPPRTAAQPRHPRPGTGTGHFDNNHGGYYGGRYRRTATAIPMATATDAMATATGATDMDTASASWVWVPLRLLLAVLLQRLLRLLAGVLRRRLRPRRRRPRQRLAAHHRRAREGARLRRRLLRRGRRRLRRRLPAPERVARPPRDHAEARGVPHAAFQGVRARRRHDQDPLRDGARLRRGDLRGVRRRSGRLRAGRGHATTDDGATMDATTDAGPRRQPRPATPAPCGSRSAPATRRSTSTASSAARAARRRTLRLRPGRHRIEVVRPGFRTVERDVEVEPGRSATSRSSSRSCSRPSSRRRRRRVGSGAGLYSSR